MLICHLKLSTYRLNLSGCNIAAKSWRMKTMYCTIAFTVEFVTSINQRQVALVTIAGLQHLLVVSSRMKVRGSFLSW